MPKSLAPPATNNAVEQQCVAQFLSGDLVLSCSIPHARRLLNKEQNPELVVDQHLSNFTGYTDICFISTRTTGSILPLIRQPDSGDATGSHCGVTRRSSLAFSLAELLSSACGRCSLPVVSAWCGTRSHFPSMSLQLCCSWTSSKSKREFAHRCQ